MTEPGTYEDPGTYRVAAEEYRTAAPPRLPVLTVAYGWVCPRCQAVNGPQVRQCSCRPPADRGIPASANEDTVQVHNMDTTQAPDWSDAPQPEDIPTSAQCDAQCDAQMEQAERYMWRSH